MDVLLDKIKGKGEVILIVDDDRVILKMVGEALDVFGYHVIKAENGLKAIDILKTVTERNAKGSESVVRKTDESSMILPDLVVLDINMPDMRGGEVLEKIKEIDPGVKVLLTTGSDINREVKDIMKQGCRGFIQKPFTITELDAKIQSILRSPKN